MFNRLLRCMYINSGELDSHLVVSQVCIGDLEVDAIDPFVRIPERTAWVRARTTYVSWMPDRAPIWAFDDCVSSVAEHAAVDSDTCRSCAASAADVGVWECPCWARSGVEAVGNFRHLVLDLGFWRISGVSFQGAPVEQAIGAIFVRLISMSDHIRPVTESCKRRLGLA